MFALNQSSQIISNFVLFQVIWFASVLLANHSLWLTLPCLLALFVCSNHKITDLKLCFICALLAFVVDGSLIASGFFILPSPSIFITPLWLLAIWLGFALTLQHSLFWLMKKPALAFLSGCIFGPLTYHAGMQLGAISFGVQTLTINLVLGCIWGFTLLYLSLYLKPKSQTLNKGD
ncbi:DUF2878 domain-containing protein [Catenovulum sp. 2E275]|uniref:DUF2878 domain-containing protein n=1 Tax=Catenovulum sp. 2E275 TaxID=2980497 RepID=UPI0021CEE5FC|nr:DUF2878 domain-containing protein [Catenovulum sp. 2E275]MCU4676853.1 DUF2878 domain-containing protein [Catenovulum sp. 2E275]